MHGKKFLAEYLLQFIDVISHSNMSISHWTAERYQCVRVPKFITKNSHPVQPKNDEKIFGTDIPFQIFFLSNKKPNEMIKTLATVLFNIYTENEVFET